ncbi:hypothetical protein [Oceanibaculum indicum]|uniref:Uncharacterized protein n=1 Tax=Oceanibaculum indicum P24 TaxID=1207063 RepID=K2KM25_9PROT|nr:hypothetical protein [Oceanibaculum indicum]EKE78520.1 hypothetical protein P24_03131 [Oceanibaculum indicum P24]
MRLTIPAPAPEPVERVAPSSFNNAEVGEGPDAGESESLSFFDFLDLINPLQHIPVVSSIYRQLTGDTIRPEMQMAGAGLLGGPLGLLAAGANAIFAAENGRGAGEEMLAQVSFGAPADAQRMAAAEPAAQPKAPAPEPVTMQATTPDKAVQPERVALNSAQANGLDALIAASNRQKEGEGARVIARFQVPPQANAAKPEREEAAAASANANVPVTQKGGVPSMMQDALQKYEALMRARQRGEAPQ